MWTPERPWARQPWWAVRPAIPFCRPPPPLPRAGSPPSPPEPPLATSPPAQIENLVIAKGYADCVAFISEGGVSVVVSNVENGLQDADVARITEIVMDETGVPASQITIIGAEG